MINFNRRTILTIQLQWKFFAYNRSEHSIPALNYIREQVAFLLSTNQRAVFPFSTNQRAAFLLSANQRAALLLSTNQSAVFPVSTNQRAVFLLSTNQRAAFMRSANQRAAFLLSTNRSPVFLQYRNCTIWGESGRYPLIYECINLTLKYVQRLDRLNDNSLVKLAFMEQRKQKLD